MDNHNPELKALDAELDRDRYRLEQLAHKDTVGLVWFGDSDEWIEKHL